MEISIKELAEIIRDVTGYKGDIVFDSSKPDGTPRRVLDNSKITAMGWEPKTDIRDGIKKEYEYYLNVILKK